MTFYRDIKQSFWNWALQYCLKYWNGRNHTITACDYRQLMWSLNQPLHNFSVNAPNWNILSVLPTKWWHSGVSASAVGHPTVGLHDLCVEKLNFIDCKHRKHDNCATTGLQGHYSHFHTTGLTLKLIWLRSFPIYPQAKIHNTSVRVKKGHIHFEIWQWLAFSHPDAFFLLILWKKQHFRDCLATS